MTFGTEEANQDGNNKNQTEIFNLNDVLEPKKAQYLQNINNKDILAESKKKREILKQ